MDGMTKGKSYRNMLAEVARVVDVIEEMEKDYNALQKRLMDERDELSGRAKIELVTEARVLGYYMARL